MGSTSRPAGHPTRPHARLAAAAIFTVSTGLGVGMAGIAPAAADPGNGNAYGATQGNAGSAAPAEAPAVATAPTSTNANGNGNAAGTGNAGGNGAGKGQGGRSGNGQGGRSSQGQGGHGGSTHAQGHAPGSTQQHGGAGHAPSHGGGTTGQGDPAGNNGTVKIASLGELDGIPDNTPHPGCTFQVEWYGFDEGADVVSTVSFTEQAPTTGVGMTVDGPTEVFVGGDPATGAGTGTGLDGTQPYTLSFTGAPHPQQGYHVRLTVSTPRSIGNDTKTKVFWVEGCGPESTTPDTTSPSDAATVATTYGHFSDSHGQAHGTEHGNPHALPVSDAEVLGEQAFAAPLVTAPVATSVGAVLPTAVNAGVDADRSPATQSTSLLAMLLVLMGGVTGRLAWTRRARG